MASIMGSIILTKPYWWLYHIYKEKKEKKKEERKWIELLRPIYMGLGFIFLLFLS
jgi:hypothetical protein